VRWQTQDNAIMHDTVCVKHKRRGMGAIRFRQTCRITRRTWPKLGTSLRAAAPRLETSVVRLLFDTEARNCPLLQDTFSKQRIEETTLR